MKYVAYFAVLIPLQLLLVVCVLRVVRSRRAEGETDSWLRLTGKVFLLHLLVNLVMLIRLIGPVAVVIWLVGMMRLSGLDVLSTFILSFSLGVVNFVGAIVLARYMDVPFLGV